ncbi:hypothetical protein CAOG_009371 [Capsaspora owczarzaki ATCC 30864]|uniref:Uncharacterized protein n=1 Tax=Capsaspora owczarzaki (strain ATCC 30864) TaxID=595528 RepID=A0A0D2U2Y0_CAPO3|nr:hypothetical protein CAOG_009371 [Capsaspora owczarzaki ATCC 30864]
MIRDSEKEIKLFDVIASAFRQDLMTRKSETKKTRKKKSYALVAPSLPPFSFLPSNTCSFSIAFLSRTMGKSQSLRAMDWNFMQIFFVDRFAAFGWIALLPPCAQPRR